MKFEKKDRTEIFVIISLSLAMILWGISAYGAPRIAVIPEEYLFGEINEGEKVTHKFIIENKGDSDLVINDVRPG